MLQLTDLRLSLPTIILLAGCAQGDQPPPPAVPPIAPPPVVTMTATDYAFEAPDTIPAGLTTIRLVNNGRELHHVVLMKAKAEMLQGMDAHGAPPPGLVVPGGPNGAAPGMTVEATLDLEPGEYSIVCLIPTAENVPHVAKGMVRPLIVTAATTTAATAAPEPDIVVKLTDYAFALSKPLTAGRHVIRVENEASQLHEMVIVKLAPGKTAKDVDDWAHDPKGPPPGMPVASASPLSTGRAVTFPVDLEPGNYGLLCFVPDAKDGKFHTLHGMIQDVKL